MKGSERITLKPINCATNITCNLCKTQIFWAQLFNKFIEVSIMGSWNTAYI